MKLNNSPTFILILLLTGLMTSNFVGCKKEIVYGDPIVWNLNHDDSIMCSRIDKKDTIVFSYTDSLNNYSKIITAIKINSEDIVSQSRSKDVDPARNSGSLIITHSKKYTYLDEKNKFPLIISIFPTFSQTGSIRFTSLFQMRFYDNFVHLRNIEENGLPGNFIIYDSLTYNNKIYTNCNYNILAFERKIGLPFILDSTGFPLWLENRSQKIYIDFKP